MRNENWLRSNWRPCAAWVYLFICLFDFFAMPVYVMRSNLKIEEIVRISSQFENTDKLNALVVLMKKNTWEPITLGENGFFHISFMAILGISAWTRGKEKEASANPQ